MNWLIYISGWWLGGCLADQLIKNEQEKGKLPIPNRIWYCYKIFMWTLAWVWFCWRFIA